MNKITVKELKEGSGMFVETIGWKVTTTFPDGKKVTEIVPCDGDSMNRRIAAKVTVDSYSSVNYWHGKRTTTYYTDGKKETNTSWDKFRSR